mmetsp:Transcript_17446/g.39509  ORF Transcript_17446/g.39509 Transcript_17446/m.39509 type:complete len:232 (-) Transcript_17446:23-718(-)
MSAGSKSGGRGHTGPLRQLGQRSKVSVCTSSTVQSSMPQGFSFTRSTSPRMACSFMSWELWAKWSFMRSAPSNETWRCTVNSPIRPPARPPAMIVYLEPFRSCREQMRPSSPPGPCGRRVSTTPPRPNPSTARTMGAGSKGPSVSRMTSPGLMPNTWRTWAASGRSSTSISRPSRSADRTTGSRGSKSGSGNIISAYPCPTPGSAPSELRRGRRRWPEGRAAGLDRSEAAP